MTARLYIRRVLLAAGVTLVFAACSGAATPGAATLPVGAGANVAASAGATASAASAGATVAVAPGSGDGSAACALLTKAEVEAAFGKTMIDPVASVDQGDATCNWAHAAGGLDLTVVISAQSSTAAALKDSEKFYGGTAVDVPGVGDAAFEAAGALEFVKGTTLVTIGTADGPGIITPDAFQGLAKLAAGRV